MKRFLIFLFLLTILCFCSFGESFLTEIISSAKNIEIVSTQKNDLENSNSFFASYIMNVEKEELSQFESIKLTVDIETGEELVKEIKIIEEQTLDNKKIVYGYVEGFYKYYFLHGKKANIQIVIADDNAYVGLPIILTSY